jgi:hypothetical protein
METPTSVEDLDVFKKAHALTLPLTLTLGDTDTDTVA